MVGSKVGTTIGKPVGFNIDGSTASGGGVGQDKGRSHAGWTRY